MRQKILSMVTVVMMSFMAVGCGGSSSPPNVAEVNETSFQNKDLYHFNLNFVDSRQRYDLKKVDGVNTQLSYQYFDFETKDYVLDSTEQQLFVNGKREALADVGYVLESNGSLEATVGGEKAFRLSLLNEKRVEANKLKEYGSHINIKGKVYESKLEYLSNFHLVKDLVTQEAFDNLEAFVTAYKTKPFLGSSFNGLVFGEGNELAQQTEGNVSKAGTYEIKTVDKKEILFLFATNVKRYGSNTCFILDFSRVWKAECHLKNSSEQLNFYDQEVYEDVLKYMQTAFVNVDISL